MNTLHLTPTQIIARVYKAFTNSDTPTLLSLLTPDCRIEQTSLLPWGGQFVGHCGALDFLGHLSNTIVSRPELGQWVEAVDQIIVVGRIRGHIVANNWYFDLPFVHDWTLRGGRVARLCVHIDTPAMLRHLAAEREADQP